MHLVSMELVRVDCAKIVSGTLRRRISECSRGRGVYILGRWVILSAFMAVFIATEEKGGKGYTWHSSWGSTHTG